MNRNIYFFVSDNKSYVGYGNFTRDSNPNGDTIKLLMNKSVLSFSKGIGAHAESQLIFNINGKGYKRLQTYAGVDYSQASNKDGKVTFKVLLDGKVTFNSKEIDANSEALKIDLDLTGIKEVRLLALSGVNNYNDHAVWADAKFITFI